MSDNNSIYGELAFALRTGADPVMVVLRELGLPRFSGIGLSSDPELRTCQLAAKIIDMEVTHCIIVVPDYEALEWLCIRYDLRAPKLLHEGPPNKYYPGNVWYVAEWLKCRSNGRELDVEMIEYIKNDLALYAASLTTTYGAEPGE